MKYMYTYVCNAIKACSFHFRFSKFSYGATRICYLLEASRVAKPSQALLYF